MRLPRTRYFSAQRFAYLPDGKEEHLALREVNERQDAVRLVDIDAATPAKLIKHIGVYRNLFHVTIIAQNTFSNSGSRLLGKFWGSCAINWGYSKWMKTMPQGCSSAIPQIVSAMRTDFLPKVPGNP